MRIYACGESLRSEARIARARCTNASSVTLLARTSPAAAALPRG
jgi:hypothetical protein